jgi:SAM-dependent methyltransferase
LFYPKFFSALPRRPKRILHFAPEPALRTCIESACESYERSALVGDDVEHHLDLTNLDFPASACDIILLNHVLDCMPDDRAAIREMWRVLKPSGVVVAVVAYEPGKATREFPPKSNTNHRAYGSEGLAERFIPFSVSALNVVNDVSPGECKRFGIPDTV